MVEFAVVGISPTADQVFPILQQDLNLRVFDFVLAGCRLRCETSTLWPINEENGNFLF